MEQVVMCNYLVKRNIGNCFEVLQHKNPYSNNQYDFKKTQLLYDPNEE